MNPWFAKGAVLAASVVLIAIRAPHGQRSSSVKVAVSRKGKLEVAPLTLAWVGFFIPLVWLVAPVLDFANYALHPAPYVAGLACFAVGLWVFHRSHADLGTNGSITLELREGHSLITRGVYRRIRHPMYSGLFLYCIGQALVLPNWLVGPSYLIAFGLLYTLRVEAEERLPLERFGPEYSAYMERTCRLIPGVW